VNRKLSGLKKSNVTLMLCEVLFAHLHVDLNRAFEPSCNLASRRAIGLLCLRKVADEPWSSGNTPLGGSEIAPRIAYPVKA
jgi:hypothetical protein